MTPAIKAVLFDLDNTLIDFLKMKRMSCEAAISAMIDAGLAMEKEDALEKLYTIYGKVGMEDKEIFQRFLKEYHGKIEFKILAAGIMAYRRVKVAFLDPYPHVHATLQQLKLAKYKLGIVTDAPRLKAWMRLVSLRLADYFDVVVTFEDTGQQKPSVLPFQAALKKLNVKPEQSVMVGDWPERDMHGAKKLGMKTVFARYGNPKVKNVEANAIMMDIQELPSILAKLK